MLVAVCDQAFGTSTSSWRKIVVPFSLPISAVRRSHSTASKGDTLPSVNRLLNARPRFCATSVFFSVAAFNVCSFSAILTSAIFRLRALEEGPSRRDLLILPSTAAGWGRRQLEGSVPNRCR